MATLPINQTDAKVANWDRDKVLRLFSGFLLAVAAILMGVSYAYPYWSMHLDAPQYEYRGGLDIVIYADRMQGKDPDFDELRELNNLNHYIGMRHLDEAATLERSIAKPSLVIFMILLVVAAVSVVTRRYWKWVWLITLPALGFPFVFAADLYYWLRDSGLDLDTTAPFSSSIKPFIPTMIGKGEVGQFATQAQMDTGWYMVVFGSLCIVVALGIAFYQARQERLHA